MNLKSYNMIKYAEFYANSTVLGFTDRKAIIDVSSITANVYFAISLVNAGELDIKNVAWIREV